LGIEKGEEAAKKLVNVTQWVKVPPGQSLASRPVEKSTCKPGNGSTELDGTRMQATLLSPEKGIVVEVPGRLPEKADGIDVAEGRSPVSAR
jgi:hypothetical protein